MRLRSWAWVWGIWAGLGAGAVQAQEPGKEGEQEPGQCAFVRGVAQSEAALLMAPQVFASVGVVNAGDAGGSAALPLGRPTPRLSAGLDYDFVGLYRGLSLRGRAEAECARYRALSGLRIALRRGRDVGAETALAARSRVLESALPEAGKLLVDLREDVKAGQATLAELNALQLRLDALNALAIETRRERERLAALPRPDGRPLGEWLTELRAADDAVEAKQQALRSASAWSVRVRGGYDELLRTPQELPLSGALTVSYSLGGLGQSGAHARARDGRRRSLNEDVEGVGQETALLLRELRASHAAEQTRLREVSVLMKDLDGQLREIEGLETVKVRRYRDYLRLELTRLRAEHAWLKAHVEEMNHFLEREGP
ncbi:hypothetical protein [Melittangium boletus]|uniref:Uncharacterized protein n=1 Tax=Melittangium boletus DSM 14713 TaxID=1294270 RepID=A0A250IND7_9BACT|nr:hypothetical protein [Melittangium boletus]ATB33254.1 hypothetical protein MEBOL_006745 [Melittangium boletus DSM 14713]